MHDLQLSLQETNELLIATCAKLRAAGGAIDDLRDRVEALEAQAAQ
jgi:hypothetical protein